MAVISKVCWRKTESGSLHRAAAAICGVVTFHKSQEAAYRGSISLSDWKSAGPFSNRNWWNRYSEKSFSQVEITV